MLAGGLGGTTGDMLMHSLDTIKTRQQGDPHMPPKYTSMGSTYYTIWRQEGLLRGLYGGVIPAFLGSFSGTVIFFGSYEWTKRAMVDVGIAPPIAYFTGGQWQTFEVIRTLYSPCSHNRLNRRSLRRAAIRPFRSPQDTTTTPRTLQQSLLQVWLQLPRNMACRTHNCADRRLARALPRLQGNIGARPSLLRPSIRLL